MPGHLFAGWVWTARAATPVLTKEKSAEAIVPAGRKDEPGRAERNEPRVPWRSCERGDDGSQLRRRRLCGQADGEARCFPHRVEPLPSGEKPPPSPPPGRSLRELPCSREPGPGVKARRAK